MEMTTDLREKDRHILKSTSMKQQEKPADFSSVHKVLDFFAQICCHFPPCISCFSSSLIFYTDFLKRESQRFFKGLGGRRNETERDEAAERAPMTCMT